MSKYLRKCCKGSFRAPKRRERAFASNPRRGLCQHCGRLIGMMNERQLASHYPVEPEK